MGVLDTGSGVFIPPTKPQMFYGMTGGQYTGQLIKGSILAGIITKENPRYILKSANIDLALVFQDHNLNLETPENNPFASYALAFFNNNNIEIIQGGDCQFIWQSKDGSVGWTKNQTLVYDRENLRLITDFMRKHNGMRNTMWQEFGPILKKRRREYFNSSMGKFSLLNGQPDFYKYWQAVELDAGKIETLIGYTDGFVIQEKTANMAKLAPQILETCQNYGLQTWLDETHRTAKAKESETHIPLPEATAIAIEF